MKYIKQFCVILGFSFAGEILNRIVPLPVPASIYGIVLLFLCLELKIVPIDSISDTGGFLIEIMPVMFIPAAVGLLDSWDIIKPSLWQYAVVTFVSTFAVMIVSGRVTQFLIRKKKKGTENGE